MRAAKQYGGVAQLARAFGSYPECHVFESHRRYQNGASKNMRPKSPDVVWAFRFQSAFAARMAYRRYLKLKILEIALRTPFAAQVGLL